MNKNKNFYVIVLAGGSGTRFWPLSRASRPKQFLAIAGKETLLQQTLGRVRQKVAGKNIFIVTNAAYRREIDRQIAFFKVPKSNILLEPQGKNTAPAICWAAARVHRICPDAVLAVLPSDHLIQNKNAFLKILDKAAALARQEYLVTLGIVPTRPEIGYGYLKTAKMKKGGILKVARFTEKPDIVTARRFLEINRRDRFQTCPYLWNSGMFVWRADVILDEFKKYLPDIYKNVAADPRQARINKIWKDLPPISVDYGILEKSSRVVAVAAAGIGWSDLGSWESLAEILPKDAQGNSLHGDVLALDCRNTLIRGGKRLIAAVGLEGLVVIDTPDALLICPGAVSQKVKDVVTALKARRRPEQ